MSSERSQERVNSNLITSILTYWSQTLVGWFNNVIKKRQLKINVFPDDLADGILLANLYELITDKKLKIDQKPKMDIQKLNNISIALKAFDEDGADVRLCDSDEC
jgi:hypothetical protein